MRLIPLFIWMMFGCLTATFAQKKGKCKDALPQAEKLYQQGHAQDAIKLLEPCMKTLHTEEELFEGYRLLGICYQFLNNEKKAVHYIELMMQLRPDYQKYPNIDPLEFTKIVDKFEVRPTWYAGVRTGFNIASIALEKSYSVYASSQRYTPTVGYQFGLFGEYMYKTFLSASVDAMMNGVFIEHRVDDAGGWVQTYKESQQYAMLQLNITYYHSTGKIVPNAGLGLGFNYLFNSTVNFETTHAEPFVRIQATKDPLTERNTLQPYLAIKTGALYHMNTGSLGIDIGYLHFLRNTIAADKRFNDVNFIFNNQYVNDDISLRLFTVNLTYRMPLVWRIKYVK